MCGIAGASLGPNDQINAKRIARAMLLAIEHRGKDATGFAFRDSTGAFQVHKDNIPATEFVKRRLCLPKASRTFIMHTRFATQGDESFNENNHPIATAGIVGVHNGHVSNDWSLFQDIDDELKIPKGQTLRIGEVDSEAIFALLGFCDKNGEPEKLLEQVRGGAAVAWMNEADKGEALHLARLSSSPLIIGEMESGSLLFASTEAAVQAGAEAAGMTIKMLRDIPEGTYMQVLAGEYASVRTFKPASCGWSSYSGSYNLGKSPTRGITDRMQSINKDWDDYEDFYLPDAHPNMTHEERTYRYLLGVEGRRASVTSLSDKLAREEPDITDSGDDSSDLEEWLELNASCNAAIERDNVRDAESQRRHNECSAFLQAPYLNSYYLSNIEFPVRVPDEKTFLSDPINEKRDETIKAWMACLKSTPENAAKAAVNLKADVLPGFPVTSDVDGIEVFGHLVKLPETFPHGDYLIRSYIPRAKRKSGFEAVFIARKYFEFDVCHSGTLTANEDEPKGTQLVKLPERQAS